MKKKQFPVFYICLIVFVVLTVIATQIGKSYLKDILTEYEDSQYKYVAEDFFESNFNNSNGETLATLFESQIPRFETKENFAKYLSKITDGQPFSLQLTTSGLNEEKLYNVICGDVKFATFTLEKASEKSEHGFDLFRPSTPVFNEKLFNSFSIEIPIGYTLKLNGNIVDDSYCLGDRIPTKSHEFMPEGIEGITYTTYTFDELCIEPSFEVFSKEEKPCVISVKDNGVYFADIVYNEELANEFSEYVIEATKAYACYMQKDAYFGKVSKYLDSSSQLYTNLKTSPNWMVIDHQGYDFEDAVAGEFYEYGEGVFSCRVTLVHVLKYPRLEDFRDTIDMTWYLREVNGKYLIYNSYTN